MFGFRTEATARYSSPRRRCGSSGWLPHRAPPLGRPDHLLTRPAPEGLLELGQVDERAEDAKATRRVRIAPGELALGLGTQGLGVRPGPGDEEALLGGQAVAGRDRVR